MRSFSTCASCNEILQVTWVGQLTHPTCQQTDEEIKLRQFVDLAQRGDEAAANALEKELNKPAAPVSMGSAALWYASIGWPVFPLGVGGKLPALPNAHPKGDPLRGVCKGECGKLGHGCLDATTDERQIRAWWGANDYGIGIATGHKFDVIDIDGARGYRSIMILEEKYGSDVFGDIHGKVHTTRDGGGEHWYIRPSGEGNRAGIDVPGVPKGESGLDYRGIGGYVCAPPTLSNGRRYTWAVKPSPEIMGAA